MRVTLVVPGWQRDAVDTLTALLHAVQAADTDRQQTHCIVLGGAMRQDSRVSALPCKEILFVDGSFGDESDAQEITDALGSILLEQPSDLVVFSGNILGSELAVRTGIVLHCPVLCDIQELRVDREDLLIGRGAYSQNLRAVMRVKTKPMVVSVMQGIFTPTNENGNPKIVSSQVVLPTSDQSIVLEPDPATDRLDSAMRLVLGGRGMGSKAGLEDLQSLCALLDAKLGVSRPVAVDGWISHDRVVGMSGSITHPDIALCFAASGAAPLITGIQASKFILAVNTDASASIFRNCDVGIVGDYKAVARALIEEIQKDREGDGNGTEQ